jgi:hypothetical protein
MKVKVDKKMYSMPKEQYHKLLQIAKEQVPKGIYAIEKKGYAELRCDVCGSATQLKALKRQFKSQGFRVYANS